MKSRILYIAFVIASLSACQEQNTYDAAGTFEATTMTISAEATGRILTLNVEEGDKIEAGMVLGGIDSTQLVLQRKQLQCQLSAVRNTAPDIIMQRMPYNEQISKLKTELERVKKMLAEGAATKKQQDDIEAQIRLIESQRDAAVGAMSNSASSINDNAGAIALQVAQLNYLIAKCQITAPISGVVQSKYSKAGEVTATGRPLLKIIDTSAFYLRAYFTSAQLADIKIGKKVKVVADYGGDKRKEYEGKICWISQECEFTPKNIQTSDTRASLVYAVKIAVNNDGTLKMGMYGEVTLN